ncbi:Deacetylases, including yeast histone deacetylase and acetoin utilization protein [hydrothermal vent metagenome]|uniref:Acetoin utilization protein AcuC n=1 Tax=hydrothermal vent metagenome TaxID=652676 RepID=A0A3B0ZZI6_9ZZZZ
MKPFVYLGDKLAAYNFGESHPFGPARHDRFAEQLRALKHDLNVDVLNPVDGTNELLLLFHTRDYVNKVKKCSILGQGFLDAGDTPAFKGVYEIACSVVGTTVNGIELIMQGRYKRGFIPISGLHHARRDSAAGFCVFNDCGVAIEWLKKEYRLQRIAYVDIDAHHGDGVYYSFVNDPTVVFADIHEDGRFLYPGTGHESEIGEGAAKGMKLNIPMPMYSDDDAFMQAWEKVEYFLEKMQPDFILFQCGADSINGDPITHLQYSPASHAHAASRLCLIADKYSQGRIMAMGGGGYNLDNIANTWCAVVNSFIEHES